MKGGEGGFWNPALENWDCSPDILICSLSELQAKQNTGSIGQKYPAWGNCFSWALKQNYGHGCVFVGMFQEEGGVGRCLYHAELNKLIGIKQTKTILYRLRLSVNLLKKKSVEKTQTWRDQRSCLVFTELSDISQKQAITQHLQNISRQQTNKLKLEWTLNTSNTCLTSLLISFLSVISSKITLTLEDESEEIWDYSEAFSNVLMFTLSVSIK